MPTIHDIDKGYNAILTEVLKLNSFFVKIGILEGSGERDGVLISQYGQWNEFGVPGKQGDWRIPPRPFIRGWVDNNKEEINTVIRSLFSQVSSGKITADIAIKRLGLYGKTGIQKYIIDSDNFKPNAPYTIMHKGSDKPLIDTMRMIQSIDSELEVKI